MELYYKSTRSDDIKVTSSEAILQGLAPDGGLYVPTVIPKLDSSMEELKNLSYQEIAYEVMRLFLTDYTEEELRFCISEAYDDKFDTEEIAPMVKVGDAYYLELFHGPTLAFKDMALAILPYLLTTAAGKNKVTNDIAILTATSGDTGKAAMAGFADVAGTRIIVFYPKNGVSQIQELQMLTQKGENTFVVAVEGNFDDTQRGVKEIFEDESMRGELELNNCQLSSANSINIGRLIPQVVYYVYAYVTLLSEKGIMPSGLMDVVVPTGNFGNILAAYYAKEMGVPIGKLICASNENKVLFDFFTTGKYNKNREFVLTSSPSMDILISSNLERLIYAISGEDTKKNLELMKSLKEKGEYEITPRMKERLKDFIGGYATEEDTRRMIKDVFEETGYTLDPHTAVAACVGGEYLRKRGCAEEEVSKTGRCTEDEVSKTGSTEDEASKTGRCTEEEVSVKARCTDQGEASLDVQLVISTASPYKFIGSVMTALDYKYEGKEELELVNEMQELTDVEIPKILTETLNAPINKEIYCRADEMKTAVREILA